MNTPTISYKLYGIYLKYWPSKVCMLLNAINLGKQGWWLPYNRTTLEKLIKYSPSAKFELNQYKEKLKVNKYKLDKNKYSWLRDYQYEDICKLINKKSHANFSEMRTGKTPVTLVTINEVGLLKWIITAPKSVIVLTWEHQIKQFFPKFHIYKAYDYKKTLNKVKRKLIYEEFINDQEASILLISKDTLKIDIENWNKKDFNMNLGGIKLKEFGLVLDEATFLKNYKTLQSKVIKTISKKAIYNYALTGTPTPKHPINIYPIMNIIAPKVFTSYSNIGTYFFGFDEWNKPFDSFRTEKHKEEWTQWLSEFGVRRTQKEVLTWLPKIERLTINVELDALQKKKYEQMAIGFTDEDNIKVPNVLVQFMKLKIITNSPYGTKKDFILEYLESNDEEQIMVVSRYSKAVLNPLKDLIIKKGYDCEIIEGVTPINKRQEIIDKVNQKQLKVLLANCICIKEGIALPGIDTLIWFDKGSLSDNQQVESRFLPITPEDNIKSKRIITLTCIETVDESSEEALIVADELNDYLTQYGKV